MKDSKLEQTLFDRARALFMEAVELSPHAREGFLARAAEDDPAAHEKVLALLRFHDDEEADSELGLLQTGDGPLRVPERIGSFRVLRLIGRGSAGAVYLATDGDGREVAVKILRADGAGLRDRFHMEGEILRRLDHPGIADRGRPPGAGPCAHAGESRAGGCGSRNRALDPP